MTLKRMDNVVRFADHGFPLSEGAMTSLGTQSGAKRSSFRMLLLAGICVVLVQGSAGSQDPRTERLERSVDSAATAVDVSLPSRLSGRVVNATGEPVFGARIDITTAAPKIGRGMFCPSCYLDCRKWATTDEDGRFAIDQLDLTLKFRVLATLPGMKPRETKLFDPASGELEIQLEPQPTDWPPERTVRGVVMSTTGRPIPGALIEPCGAKTAEKTWGGLVEDVEFTVTDNDGKFAMLIPADYQGLNIEVTADGHAGAKSGLLAPGATHTVEVPVGAHVTARLVHQSQPVAGLRVAVVQTDRSSSRHFIQSVTDTTNRDGRCRFEYLPPDEECVIYSLAEGSADANFAIATTKFQTPKDNGTLDLGDIEVVPALSIKGRIELQGAGTIPEHAHLILDRDPAWDLASVPISTDGSFVATGLPPDTYMLLLSPRALVFLDTTPIPKYPSFDDRIQIKFTESRDDIRWRATMRTGSSK